METFCIRKSIFTSDAGAGLVMDELKRRSTKKPRSQREKRGFLDFAGLLRMSRWFRPESMSSVEAAWLLGFLGGLSCGMDTRVDIKLVRV